MPATAAPIPTRDARPRADGARRLGNAGPPQPGNRAPRPSRGKPPRRSTTPRGPGASSARRGDDDEILFQKFFKSVGPRTYAAQVKRAKNKNEYLVLMEGKRDAATGDVRKTRLFIYSEDFVEFFRLIKSAAEYIKTHPLPADVRAKREKYWAREHRQPQEPPAPPRPAAAAAPPCPGRH